MVLPDLTIRHRLKQGRRQPPLLWVQGEVMQRRIGILLSTSLLVTAGCFHYVPTRLGETSPGMEVRVLVSPEQAGRLNQQIGTEGELIRGRLVDQLDEALLIETPVLGSRTRIYQRVRIPLGEVVGVEARKLGHLKTGLLIGAITGTASAVIATVFIQGTNRRENPPDGIDNRIMIPLFRLYR